MTWHFPVLIIIFKLLRIVNGSKKWLLLLNILILKILIFQMVIYQSSWDSQNYGSAINIFNIMIMLYYQGFWDQDVNKFNTTPDHGIQVKLETIDNIGFL
jgi:hypothetical protein